MRRRFLSLSVRPTIYFALATLLALTAVFIDQAFIPNLRYSPAYFRAIALFAVPSSIFLYLGQRSTRNPK